MLDNYKNKLGTKLLIVNAFVCVPPALYAPFLSAYYSKAGLNSVEVGILMTIGPLVAIFLQPFWAALSDSSGKRKDVVSLLALGSGITILSFYIGNSFPVLLCATFLLALFSTAIGPLCDAIEIHTAQDNGLDFSRIRMGGTIGYAITVIAAGYIVRINPELEFLLGFAGYLFLFCFIRLLPRDRPCMSGPAGKPYAFAANRANLLTKGKKKPGTFKLFESGQIYFMLLFALIGQVGITFNNSFLGIYMIRLGYSEGMIGFMSCIAAVSEIPVLLLINRMLHKVKPIWLIALAGQLMGLRILMTTQESIGFIILGQALNGLTYMVIYYCCAIYISRNVKPSNQSKGQSVLTAVQAGIGSIAGNLAGGYLCDAFGIRAAYVYVAASLLGACATLTILQIFIFPKEIVSTDRPVVQ